MNIPIGIHDFSDIVTALLVFTFIPMIVATMFILLAYNRSGYGRIGIVLCTGFCVLVVSLFLGLMFNLEREPWYQIAAGITRVFGWSVIAIGYIMLFLEVDKSLP